MAKDGYKDVAALIESDEYQEKGVLGRDRLITEHFPEAMPFANQQGQRKIVGRNREVIEAKAHEDAQIVGSALAV